MSDTKTFLLNTSELGANSIKKVDLPGRDPVAVVTFDGAFYVIDDFCSHGMASLAEGELDGPRIECPWHSGAFDVRTGAAVERPCTAPVKTYAPIIEDGALFIVLGEARRALAA